MNGKILLMDDDDSVRRVIREYLEELGCEVIVAVEGGEAVELYEAAKEVGRPFDVACLDLQNDKGTGGLWTIRKLKKIDPEVKAIVWSGVSNHYVLADPVEYGFFGALAKPFPLDQLAVLLSQESGD